MRNRSPGATSSSARAPWASWICAQPRSIWPVPGVEIHAQALEQMLARDHLMRPAYATGAELLFLVGIGAAVTWLIYRLGAVATAVIGALAILAVFAASWLAYRQAGLVFDPVYPSLAILVLYLATSLNSYVKTELERNRVRSAFSHYVAAPLVCGTDRQSTENYHVAGSAGGETRLSHQNIRRVLRHSGAMSFWSRAPGVDGRQPRFTSAQESAERGSCPGHAYR